MGYSGDKKREYQRKWVAARRADYFKDKFCVDCGSNSNLELDHVDPETKIAHAIWSWSETRRLQEIEKCLVRCKECHLTKSRINGDLSRNKRLVDDIEILEIREKYNTGFYTQKELGIQYGIARRTVGDIVTKTSFKYV